MPRERHEYMKNYYDRRKEYFQLRYLDQKISKLMKMNLPPEEIQKLIRKLQLKYEAKKRLQVLQEQEEKEAEAKRRYDFIYN